MPSVQHTVTAAVNPTAAPPSVGAHYTNTLTGQQWISHGVGSVADWGRPLPGSVVTILQTVTDWTLNKDAPAVLWQVTRDVDYILKFPVLSEPGCYEMEVVLECNNGSPVNVLTEADPSIAPIYFHVPNQLVAYNGGATYYKFRCWRAITGVNTCWTVAETKFLDGDRPVYADADGSAQMLILSDAPQTFWDIYQGVSKRLVLPTLSQTFANDLFTKVDLVVRNNAGDTLTLTIDQDLGNPLAGHSSLSVPDGATMLFRLAYFVGNAQYRWSLLDSHALVEPL